MTGPPQLTKKDFASDQEVRWCPGCGDYAILSAAQGVFAEDQPRGLFAEPAGPPMTFTVCSGKPPSANSSKPGIMVLMVVIDYTSMGHEAPGPKPRPLAILLTGILRLFFGRERA